MWVCSICGNTVCTCCKPNFERIIGELLIDPKYKYINTNLISDIVQDVFKKIEGCE